MSQYEPNSIERCPPPRSDKYLMFAPTGGLGNQWYGLQTAVWLAYALRRTLVLPPLLSHHAFSGGYKDHAACSSTTASTKVRDVALGVERVWQGHQSWPSWERLLAFDEIAPLSTVQISC